MKKILLGACAVATAVAAALVTAPAASGQSAGTPSAKAAFTSSEVIALSALASPETPAGDTGWQTVLSTQMKTSSQKDLIFDASLQCGLVTDTTVKSSGGNASSATARANISVRILVDAGMPNERVAVPSNSLDANKASAEGVVYCDRIQTLAAKFAGLDCTADLTTGVVTCATDEELQLILKTMNAHSFNFALDDLGSGVHSVQVQARAQASVNFDDGNLAGAEAFAGAGSLFVEEVRLVKDAELVELG